MTARRSMNQSVRSVATLKKKTEEILQIVESQGGTVIIKDRGRTRAVLQDERSYRRLLEQREQLEEILAIKEGIRDMKAGRMEPAGKVFAQLRKKHGLQG